MIAVKTMNEAELGMLLDWAAVEGWNPGLDDAAAYYSADPEGFLMVLENEEPAACVSVVKQGEHHGFLGLYISAPKFRGKGYGWVAWQAGMDYLAGRSVGLDGVVEQQDNYRKSGFDLQYRNIRFTGPVDGLLNNAGAVADSSRQFSAFAEQDLAELLALDRAVSGVNRDLFMQSWSAGSATRHTLVCRRGNALTGFGTIRECVNQYKLGPIVCDNETTALQLMCSLIKLVGAQSITLDVPEPHRQAMELATHGGLQPVFETARMYRGDPPPMDLNRLFGVATLELG